MRELALRLISLIRRCLCKENVLTLGPDEIQRHPRKVGLRSGMRGARYWLVRGPIRVCTRRSELLIGANAPNNDIFRREIKVAIALQWKIHGARQRK